MALPAYAEYFCSVTNIAEIQQALAFAKANSLQVTPLGGGSNIVIAGDIKGLVVHLNLRGISSAPVNNDQVEVTFAAGTINNAGSTPAAIAAAAKIGINSAVVAVLEVASVINVTARHISSNIK